MSSELSLLKLIKNQVLIFKADDAHKTNTIDERRATNVCTEADTLSIYSALTY